MTALGAIQSTTEMAGIGDNAVDLKLSVASKGGVLRVIDNAAGDTAITASAYIENEKYGVNMARGATAVSAEFDSAVKRTGKFTVKLSNTDATGKILATMGDGFQGYCASYPIKSSTTYRLNCFVKTVNAAAASVYTSLTIRNDSFTAYTETTVNSTKYAGTNDWFLIALPFTTVASRESVRIAFFHYVAGNVSDAFFDVNSMMLEEIVTDTTFTGKVSEKIRPVFQAVTTHNINANSDQSLDFTGGYANTYTPPVAVDEGATHRQTFTPTKKYITQIGVYVVDKGTGNWTLLVHDAANVLIAQQTIVNASLTNSVFNYFDVPNIWTTGALHFHVISTVADGTIRVNTSNDEETASYIQRYAKKTENFTLVCNGVKTSLSADRDGLLNGAVIDIDNGKYSYANPFNSAVNFSDIFSCSVGGGSTAPDVLNGWDWANTLESLQSVSDATARNIVIKVNTLLPIKHLKLVATLFNNNTAAGQLDISPDNVTYTALQPQLAASASAQTFVYETDLVNGLSVFYVKIYKSTENTYLRIDDLKIDADIVTSKVPTGLFYPLIVNQFAETVKLPSVATRVYFRTAKFTNEYGVVVPALEFTDTTPTTIGYLPLKLDNSQETSPCVSILSTTTNYQQSGTGSNVTNGYVLNDGEYMTLTGTTAELKVDYQVGTGTTAIAAITKNALFLSSNGVDVESTQDPSYQMNVIVGVRQQSVAARQADVGEELALIRQNLSTLEMVIKEGSYLYGMDAGTTDAYAVLIPNVTRYVAGMMVNFKANTANTDACTLAINDLPAIAIKKLHDQDTATGDIEAGQIVTVIYDGTYWQMQSQKAQ